MAASATSGSGAAAIGVEPAEATPTGAVPAASAPSGVVGGDVNLKVFVFV